MGQLWGDSRSWPTSVMVVYYGVFGPVGEKKKKEAEARAASNNEESKDEESERDNDNTPVLNKVV